MKSDPPETWTDDSAAVAQPSAEAAPERFEDRAELGRGGLGRVVEVYDRALGRSVARKELLRPSGPDRQRFLREARITARLDHPNIPPVHDLGQQPDGTPYYTMRVVEGRSLHAALASEHTLAGRLRFLDRVVDVCGALSYAHARGVVHRDVKPANILLGRFGETWLVDWGLAVQRGEDTDEPLTGDEGPPADPALTRIGAILGTPAYMSPEQARGEPADERSDQFAVGAILHELLVGRPPVDTSDPHEIVARVGAAPLAPLAAAEHGVPADLAAVVDRALAFDPERRYPSVEALAEDLRAWRDGRRVVAYEYSPGQALALLARRHRAALITAALVAVAAAALVAGWVGTLYRSDLQKREALAAAYAREARTAADDDDLFTASLYASEALALGESPHARGVLARARAAWMPELAGTAPVVAGCQALVLAGDRMYCGGPYGAWASSAGRLIWRQPLEAPVLALEVRDDRLELFQRDALVTLDAATGAVLAESPLHMASGARARSASGTLAVAERSTLRITAPRADTEVRFRPDCDGHIGAVGWIDDVTLVAACGNGTVLTVDPSRGTSRERARFGEIVTALLIDGDAMRIGIRGRVVELAPDGSRRRTWPGPDELIQKLARSPDGRWMVGATDVGTVLLWPWEAEDTPAAHLPPHRGTATFTFGPGGELWTIGSLDDAVRIWTLPPPIGNADTHAPGITHLALSPDRDRAAIRLGSGRIRSIDARSLATQDEWTPPDGLRIIAMGWHRGRPTVIHGNTWSVIGGDPMSLPHPAYEFGAWTGGDDYLLQPRGMTGLEKRSAPAFDRVEAAWASSDEPVGFEEAGAAIAAILPDGTVTLLDPETLAPLGAVRVDHATIRRVEVSPSRRFVAVAEGVLDLRVIDLTDGTERRLEGHEARASALEWWGDERLVTGHWDADIRIWDVDAGETLAVLEGHTGRVGQVVLGDEVTLLSAGWGGRLLRWDLTAVDAAQPDLAAWTRDRTGLDLGVSGPAFVGR